MGRRWQHHEKIDLHDQVQQVVEAGPRDRPQDFQVGDPFEQQNSAQVHQEVVVGSQASQVQGGLRTGKPSRAGRPVQWEDL